MTLKKKLILKNSKNKICKQNFPQLNLDKIHRVIKKFRVSEFHSVAVSAKSIARTIDKNVPRNRRFHLYIWHLKDRSMK